MHIHITGLVVSGQLSSDVLSNMLHHRVSASFPPIEDTYVLILFDILGIWHRGWHLLGMQEIFERQKEERNTGRNKGF